MARFGQKRCAVCGINTYGDFCGPCYDAHRLALRRYDNEPIAMIRWAAARARKLAVAAERRADQWLAEAARKRTAIARASVVREGVLRTSSRGRSAR